MSSQANGGSVGGAKQLIITSDDFGMCHAVNAGIVQAMAEGVVTSTTLMAPCPWFAEAAELSRRHRLAVGVHLCVTCEWDQYRWGPITAGKALRAADGNFFTSIPEAGQAELNDIVDEFDAQVLRVKSHGIEPTHVDMHMLSGDDSRPGAEKIRSAMREVCRRHGLMYTRDYLPERGLIHFTGQIGSSGASESQIWQWLEAWKTPGVYHIIAHVAAAHSELEGVCSVDHPSRPWAASYRIADFEFMTKPSTRKRIAELGFELIDVPTFLRRKKPSGI